MSQMKQKGKNLEPVNRNFTFLWQNTYATKNGKWLPIHKEVIPWIRQNINSSHVSDLMALTLNLPIHMDKMCAIVVKRSEAFKE